MLNEPTKKVFYALVACTKKEILQFNFDFNAIYHRDIKNIQLILQLIINNPKSIQIYEDADRIISVIRDIRTADLNNNSYYMTMCFEYDPTHLIYKDSYYHFISKKSSPPEEQDIITCWESLKMDWAKLARSETITELTNAIKDVFDFQSHQEGDNYYLPSTLAQLIPPNSPFLPTYQLTVQLQPINNTLQPLGLEDLKEQIEVVAGSLTNYKKALLKVVHNLNNLNYHIVFIRYIEQIEHALVTQFIKISQPTDYQSQDIAFEKKSLGFISIEARMVAWISLKTDIITEELVIRPLSKLAAASEFMHRHGAENRSVHEVHEDSSTVPMPKKSLSYLYSNLIQEETVNLDIFPLTRGNVLTENDCLVLGDLHGNALKLIYFLLYENVIKGITEADYQELLRIYLTPIYPTNLYDRPDYIFEEGGRYKSYIDSMKNMLKRYNEIIAQLVPVNPGACPTIFLIGDEVADRGNNDYFTLKLLEQLTAQKIPITILLSNHGLEFLRVYEENQLNNVITVSWMAPFNVEMQPSVIFTNSLLQMGELIRTGLIEKQEVITLIENTYLPLLTGLVLNVNKESKQLSFITHAPVSINIIRELADQLGISYDTNSLFLSADSMIAVAGEINRAIEQLIATKCLAKNIHPCSALYKLVWLQLKNQAILDERKESLLPEGWSIQYVHGHEGNGRTSRVISPQIEICDLDNFLGKISYTYYKRDTNHRRPYNALYFGNNPNFVKQQTKKIETYASTDSLLSSSSMFKSTASLAVAVSNPPAPISIQRSGSLSEALSVHSSLINKTRVTEIIPQEEIVCCSCRVS